MERHEFSERREEIFSRAVKAGKRTYFFDVKATKNGQYYLTITESKRRFNHELGKFFYEKHKIFLFREDFEKFIKGFDASIRFIEMDNDGTFPNSEDMFHEQSSKENQEEIHRNNPVSDAGHVDIRFEDLGSKPD